MSIVSLPRQHLKHHPDQAVIPVEKPRGVNAPRLACVPGTSANVMRTLRAETARHHMPADLVPLPMLRTVPLVAAPVADETALAANATAVHDATTAANAVLDDIAAALNELAAMIGGAR